VERIFRFHLEPSRGFTAVIQFVYCSAKDREMRLTVEEVTKTRVDLAALGNVRGQVNGENLMGARSGDFPMGVAFRAC
jgi:hypothetical protein